MWGDTREINTAAAATTVLTQEISLTDRWAKLQKSVCATSQIEAKSLCVSQRRYQSKCFHKGECQCGINKARHAGQTSRKHSYAKPSQIRCTGVSSPTPLTLEEKREQKRGEEKRNQSAGVCRLIHLFHSHLGGFKWTHRTEIREPYGS